MAASAWTIYHSAKEFIGDGTFDMDNDAFKIALMATSYPASATHQVWAAVASSETATGNGYTGGGNALSAVTWTRATGKVTFDAADESWGATGGSISGKYAVIYDDATATATGDPVTDGLLCYSNLSSTGGDVSVTDGNTLTIQFATSGIFTVT